MNKLAIFVEGQTELLFIQKLIDKIATEKNVVIRKAKACGGRRTNRIITMIEASTQTENASFFILLSDCGCDNRVASDIRENYNNLSNDYIGILGIRDVYPRSRADIPRILHSMKCHIPTSPLTVEIVLAIMEIEAWFLGETTHFTRIDPNLSQASMIAALGFDPRMGDLEDCPKPSDDLNLIYSLVEKHYKKNRLTVQQTNELSTYPQPSHKEKRK